MTCRKGTVKENLPEYLTNRLSSGRRKMVSEHLQACKECRQELSLMQNLFEDHVPEPPAEFWTSLPARVRSSIGEQERRWYRLPVSHWAGGIAVAALLILFVVMPWRGARIDIQVPGEYLEQMTGGYAMGMEEEILSISGLSVIELDHSLDPGILSSNRFSGPDSLGDMYPTDLFEGMDGITLDRFERLIDEISPMS